TIARLAAGHLELDRGRAERAARHFREIVDPGVTPKFFLHWYWRMNARSGLCGAWLASGQHEQARAEADDLLDAASSTDDPNLHVIARETQARVAIADEDWDRGEAHMQAAVALAEQFDIPTSAWRVHATAAELYRRSHREAAAEEQRARGEVIVRMLVD